MTLEAYERLGVMSGPVFRVSLKGTKKVRWSAMGDLDVLFHGALLQVQEHCWSPFLPSTVKVQDETSVWRSLRWGSTMVASNRGTPHEVIEANQCCRKHQWSRGILPRMSMMEGYSDAKSNIGYLIRYSMGL
jgi:hypothetical protein